jgi:hypothetical protein
VLEHKKSYERCIFQSLPNVCLKKHCSWFFKLGTSHQILVFGIKGLGGQICKTFEYFYNGHILV